MYLVRIKMSETQTQKSRLERLENVQDVFKVKKPEILTKQAHFNC